MTTFLWHLSNHIHSILIFYSAKNPAELFFWCSIWQYQKLAAYAWPCWFICNYKHWFLLSFGITLYMLQNHQNRCLWCWCFSWYLHVFSSRHCSFSYWSQQTVFSTIWIAKVFSCSFRLWKNSLSTFAFSFWTSFLLSPVDLFLYMVDSSQDTTAIYHCILSLKDDVDLMSGFFLTQQQW